MLNSIGLVANTPQFIYLWSDLESQSLNAQGKLLHRRTVLNMGVTPGSFSTVGSLAYYMMVFQQDDTPSVVAQMIMSPITGGQPLAEKPLMLAGYKTLAPGTGIPNVGLNNWTEDVKAIRKFDDTEVIGLVVEATIDCTWLFQYRTFCQLSP